MSGISSGRPGGIYESEIELVPGRGIVPRAVMVRSTARQYPDH